MAKYQSILRPSELPMIADLSAESEDMTRYWGMVSGALLDPDYPHPDAEKYGWPVNVMLTNISMNGPAPNHRGKINYLFSDFHAASVDSLWPFDVTDPYNGPRYRKAFHPRRRTVMWGNY